MRLRIYWLAAWFGPQNNGLTLSARRCYDMVAVVANQIARNIRPLLVKRGFYRTPAIMANA
jgi:hypothetical protein